MVMPSMSSSGVFCSLHKVIGNSAVSALLVLLYLAKPLITSRAISKRAEIHLEYFLCH
jgi:hypothetical protein